MYVYNETRYDQLWSAGLFTVTLSFGYGLFILESVDVRFTNLSFNLVQICHLFLIRSVTKKNDKLAKTTNNLSLGILSKFIVSIWIYLMCVNILVNC